MSGAYDVKALQARLGNLRDKRDEVERSLSTMRGPPRDQARGHSPSPPPRGSLASRLGGSPPRAPRGRLASRLGPAMAGGGMGSFRDSRGPPERGRGLMRRRSEDDEEEESNGGKKRLKSAVSVPGKDDDDDDKAPHRGQEEEAMDEGAGEKENKAADGDGWGDEGATHGSSSNMKVEEGHEEGEGRPAPLRRVRSRQEDELKAETRGEGQQIYKQADVQQRNRRLFGALMGHLGKAKERITKDEGGILAKQNSVMAAVVDKDQGQSEKIRQRLRESRFKARRTEERKRAEIVKEQRAVELELDLARFANSLIKCKGFLRTKAEPAVYFMPKQLSEAAKALLVQTQEDMQARIREREEEVKAAIQELEADFIKNWPLEEPTEGDDSHHDGEESSSSAKQQNGGSKHEDDMEQDKAAAENGADEDEGKAEKGKEEQEADEEKKEDETAAMDDDDDEE